MSAEFLLTGLASCIAGTAPTGRENWDLWAENHLEALGYYYAHDQLPSPWKEHFAEVFKVQSARSLQLEYQWQSLKRILLDAGIRFCPIKGVDLAFRIYPHPALRPMGDFDILFHPEDCDRAWQLVLANGWSTPLSYSHAHHFSVLYKGNLALEVHFGLPGLPTLPIAETWTILPKDAEGVFRLPQSLNLIMLFAHAQNHQWQNGLRMLLDMKFLIKNQEWPSEDIRRWCTQWRLPDPQLVRMAFPEFFDAVESHDFPPQVVADLRELVLAGSEWSECKYEIIMSGSKRFSLPWLTQRIKGCSPRGIRLKYGIYHGQYGKVLYYYGKDLARKFKILWQYRNGTKNPELKNHVQRLERVQRFLQD